MQPHNDDADPFDDKRFLQLIQDLYGIVGELEGMFPGRPFTPDAHMVGSLAECFAEYYYGLNLYACSYPGHDAHTADCNVEIKATQGKSGSLRSGPDRLLVFRLFQRSVYQKYGAIFEYFDSYLIGLTATPKSEVDKNTYGLFDLEKGVPTYSYELEEAVKDGYLVPSVNIEVPGKFQRVGIKYDELSEEEKEEWEAIDWDEEGNVPAMIEPAALNRW